MTQLFAPLPEKVTLGTYPYAYARVSAMKGKLLRAEEYHKLLKLSLPEIAKNIQELEYKHEIDQLAVEYEGVELLTRALDLHFQNIMAKLRRIADEELMLLIEGYLKRNDIANIKTIIRGKVRGMAQDEIKMTLLPGGTLEETMQWLIQAESRDELANRIAALGMSEFSPLKKLIQEGALPDVDLVLDRVYYRYVLSLANRCAAEGQPFADFLRNELDNRNLFTMLRLRKAKIPVPGIKEQLLPAGRKYKIPQLLQWTALSDEELAKQLQQRGIPYGEITAAQLEVQQHKQLLDSAVLLLHRYPLSVDVILGFLFAKEVEMRNLRMIIMGKHLGIAEEFIEKNLVM